MLKEKIMEKLGEAKEFYKKNTEAVDLSVAAMAFYMIGSSMIKQKNKNNRDIIRDLITNRNVKSFTIYF